MGLPRSPKLLRALAAAGILLDEPSPPLPPGTVICEFEVPMRPVPWKAPSTTRTGHSYKDPKLVAWQAEVSRCAEVAMRGRRPYPGPVLLTLEFYLTRRAGSLPDLSNLTKAFEDSLQGSAIVNDRCVREIHSERIVGDRDGAWVRVTSLMESP